MQSISHLSFLHTFCKAFYVPTSNSCISTPIENWTHVYMNLFTRNSPYYHLLKYLLSLLKHPVYTCVLQNTGTYSVTEKDGLSFFFWLLPQISEDSEDFIFQQDEAPPPLAPGCSTFSKWISTPASGKKIWRFSSGPRDLLISYPATFSCGGS